jgi:hypothetical protein
MSLAEDSSVLEFDFVFPRFPTFRRIVMRSCSRKCSARRVSLLDPRRWKLHKLSKHRKTTPLSTRRHYLGEMKSSVPFRFMLLHHVKFRATQRRQNTKFMIFKSS